MNDIYIQYPDPVNLPRLAADLRAALTNAFIGLSQSEQAIIVHLLRAPTDAERAQAQTVVAAHDPAALTPEQKAVVDLKARVMTLARSAEGVMLDELTALQQRTMLAALLWQTGALDGELRVRPLEQWMKPTV